jgi:hypothetical protein
MRVDRTTAHSGIYCTHSDSRGQHGQQPHLEARAETAEENSDEVQVQLLRQRRLQLRARLQEDVKAAHDSARRGGTRCEQAEVRREQEVRRAQGETAHTAHRAHTEREREHRERERERERESTERERESTERESTESTERAQREHREHTHPHTTHVARRTRSRCAAGS